MEILTDTIILNTIKEFKYVVFSRYLTLLFATIVVLLIVTITETLNVAFALLSKLLLLNLIWMTNRDDKDGNNQIILRQFKSNSIKKSCKGLIM